MILVVVVILIFVIVFGNLFICWVVIWNLIGELKILFNYLVVNFVIFDFIIGLIIDLVFVDFYVKEVFKVKEFLSV